MKANFHTHTTRCRHATGTDRKFVESAIERGLTTLGFSDHSPYIFPDGYYSGHRMRPEETEGYVRSLLDLREEYKKDIELYIGFEMEYYPAFYEQTIRFLEQFPYDYLILGQHFVRNEIGNRWAISKGNGEADLIDYVNECIAGLQTGKYFYLAHPDMVNYSENTEIYQAHMKRLCETAKALSVPLEINLLGIRGERHYPNDLFWEIAGKTGNDVILGCDAHEPQSVARPDDLEKANALVKKYGLHLIEPTCPSKRG